MERTDGQIQIVTSPYESNNEEEIAIEELEVFDVSLWINLGEIL